MGAPEQNSSPQKQPSLIERDAFDSSIAFVRDYANRIERNYARPILNSSWTLFEERPALAIFIVIFASLSLIPVVSFLGVCVFVVASFTAIALGCAFVAISAVLLALSAIMISILCVTLLTSIFLTLAVISSYMVFRLAALIRQGGSSGFSSWAGEAKQHFLDHTRRASHKQRDCSDTLSEFKPAGYSHPSDGHFKVQD